MTSATGPTGPTPTLLTETMPRRPTLVRKREEDEIQVPSSPSKRAKVTFEPAVEVRVVEEWEKSPAVIRESVRRAIKKHATGDNAGYEQIKAIFVPAKDDQDEASPTTVKNYTAALLSTVTLLDKTCTDLISLVLDSNWLERSEDYFQLFTQFLANLVSTQGSHLSNVLRMLAENLTATPPSQNKRDVLPRLPRSQIYARVHKTLQYLLQIVPSACRVHLSILTDVFPHQSDSRRAHVVYVHNLLKITDYAPVLQTDILALITERLVKIDLQVQEDLEDLAEDAEEGVVQHLPRAGNDMSKTLDDPEDTDDDSDSDEEMDEETLRTREIAKNVGKMDSILEMLFTYYDQQSSASSAKNPTLFLDTLLSQFQTIILPTHRSRHTQFILFHFIQQSPRYIDIFVGMCAQASLDKRKPAVMRQAAAAYLASFVARGTHVSTDIVQEVWDYLSTELKRLYREYEPGCRGPDPERYSIYYSIVQALLYIFCFRWRDLECGPGENFEDAALPSIYDEERHWRAGVKETFQLNIFSKLNPLKVCSSAIVTEFAQIASQLQVVFVYHILETNKRIRISRRSGPSSYTQVNRETALSVRHDDEHQHLDEYFPFDPYHLPRSKRWIEGDYREWKGIPRLDDGKEAESESEAEVAVDSDGEDAPSTEDSKD
ncbi:MAG: hypothetical protein Q9219_000278 [cf. Caloplaca sp. 3 TL-2023]